MQQLQNGKQQFVDSNGVPLVGGSVYFYQPNTEIPLTTWQDQAGTTPNTNPVDLDDRGQAVIWGNTTYRQIVYDVLGNLIWDQIVDAGAALSQLASGGTTASGASLIGWDDENVAYQLTNRINRVVTSIGALRSLTHTIYTMAFATGYYASHDGGGGAYQYDPNDTSSADNGGTIIVAHDGARWKLQYFGSVSIKQFGATGNGTTDDTTTSQAFFNFVTQNGIKGIVSAGNYLLSSLVTITLGASGFTIEGPGCDSAQFIAASTFAGATAVLKLVGVGQPVGWRIGGFSILASSGGAGAATIGFQIGDPTVAAINIYGYQFSTIFDVYVNGFSTLWQIAHVRMIRFVDCAAWNQTFATANTCLLITQNGSFTGDLLFDKFQCVSTDATGNSCLDIASTSGPYNNTNGNNSIAGIKFRSCDFYAGAQAINIFASAQSYVADIWFVDGCQIDQQTVDGIQVTSQNSGTLIEDLHFDGIYINKSTGQTATFASTGTQGTIKSVWFERSEIIAAQNDAISFFGPGCQDLHVNDNTMVDCGNNGAAIEFNQCTGVKASNNKARTGLLNLTPFYLLGFDSGTTNIYAQGNDAVGVARVGTINDQSGDTVKVIANNPGYNPLGPQAITVGASPFSYKNTTGAPQAISLAGGTVSALTLNGWGITPAASMIIPVPQGGTLIVTYSVLPNMNSFGL